MVHPSREAAGRRVQISESGSVHKGFVVYGGYINFAKASSITRYFYLSKSAFYGLLGTDLPDRGLLVPADVVI